jgi:short subunit fatty acids transporter
MGNLVSPFWYVIVAGVARIEFRKFLGYGLIFAPLWFLLGVLIFTYLPC